MDAGSQGCFHSVLSGLLSEGADRCDTSLEHGQIRWVSLTPATMGFCTAHTSNRFEDKRVLLLFSLHWLKNLRALVIE
jgi:hypothetical protein